MITPELFYWIVYLWIAVAILIFPVLLRIKQPYGRHSSTTWGPMINNRLGWFVMEIPALTVFVFFIFAGKGLNNTGITVFFMLWVIHYFYRSIIFPFRIRSKKKKMPVLIMLSAVFFNLVNGFVNGYWFGFISSGYELSWFYDPRFILGIIFFGGGFAINQYHDQLLIQLRKNSGNDEYKIPFGGLFRYVSCPNFLGEIIEWGGFALMTWCLPTFSFFIWTFVNLVPRALDHHRWYKEHFSEYPADRKAILPKIL